jgi:hypothetical protein
LFQPSTAHSWIDNETRRRRRGVVHDYDLRLCPARGGKRIEAVLRKPVPLVGDDYYRNVVEQVGHGVSAQRGDYFREELLLPRQDAGHEEGLICGFM